MFWEQFWSNYLSSVLAGITLGGVGGFVYYRFFHSKNIFRPSQDIKEISAKRDVNISQQNIMVSGARDSTTTKKDKNIIEEYVKREN